MRYFFTLLAAVILAISTAPQALSAASDWQHGPESSIRLISSGQTQENGVTTLHLGIHFTLKDNWKVYWRTPGDGGIPVTVDWQDSQNIENPTILWPAPKRYVEHGSIESFGYKHAVVYPITATIPDTTTPTTINALVNYAVCDEICLFLSNSLTLTIPPQHTDPEAAALIERFTALTSLPDGGHGLTFTEWGIAEEDASGGIIHVSATSQTPFTTTPDIFIEGAAHLRFPKPSVSISGNTVTFAAPFQKTIAGTSLAEEPLTLTLVDGDRAIEKPTTLTPLTTTPFLQILLFAILGGLILNIMPCVLPVLSIKLLSVVQHGGSTPARVRASFLSSAAGVITSFIALAAIVTLLKSAGMAAGWGFHFQEPLFLIFLVLILNLFAANLWGLFEIALPNWLGSTLSKKRSIDEHSLSGHFFSGAFATLLATPCSAPFLGTAIGFAFSRGASEIFLIFTLMGVGLALPYLLVALRPALVSRLPKPGHWMITVKYILGIFLAGTAVWLIWVLAGQLGNQAAFVLAGISLLLFAVLWGVRHWSLGDEGSSILPIILLLSVISLLIPSIYPSEASRSATEKLWIPFNEAKITTLVEQGNTVFVDVTADWCITCKANKLLVLDTSKVTAALSAPNVVAMRADLTNPSRAISDYLARHNRYGIPFNAAYGPSAPEGIVLSELLTKSAVLQALSDASTPKE